MELVDYDDDDVVVKQQLMLNNDELMFHEGVDYLYRLLMENVYDDNLSGQVEMMNVVNVEIENE